MMPDESLKLYFDTNIAKQIALQLRARGVDVVRCEEVGMAEAKDWKHLEYAIEQGRAVVSFDRHFPGLHAKYLSTGRDHKGIFYVANHLQGDDGIGVIVRFLLEYHEMVEAGAGTVEDDIYNHLFFVRE
jgi:predicted nuclease of predicted toxin-antitoxin system